jgi:hypothetical protein
MSVLKPEGSLMLGTAVAAMSYGIYSFSVPNTAITTSTLPHDASIESARKKAAWTATAVVSAVSVLAKDKTIFILGGLVIVALDWHTRHANAVHPETGKVVDAPTSAYQDVATRTNASDQGGTSAPAPAASAFAFG